MYIDSIVESIGLSVKLSVDFTCVHSYLCSENYFANLRAYDIIMQSQKIEIHLYKSTLSLKIVCLHANFVFKIFRVYKLF